MRQRGFTLVEVAVAAAILAVAAAAFCGLSQATRTFGARSAITQFDAALSYAQSLARSSGNGATLVFDKRTLADGSAAPGFVLRIYAGRPTAAGALTSASVPPIDSVATVSEPVLGSVPFTLFLNGSGHASGMSGKIEAGTVLGADPGCPAGEASITLAFSVPALTAARTLPCSQAVAGAPAGPSPLP